MATPDDPPLFEEANPPLKYGRRSTSSLSTLPGARIPGTAMPTLGVVSNRHVSVYLNRPGIATYNFR